MYSTTADLGLTERDLIDLTDDAGTGQVNSAVVGAAITRADKVVESYLRGRYNLPFDPVPSEVTEISSTIARYYLYERRQTTPPEGIRKAYDDARGWLKDLQIGRATLNETGQAEDLDRTPGRIVVSDRKQVFPPSLLDRF